MAFEPTRPRGIFLAGDRVFDTVSGLEGTVVETTSENIIVPNSDR